MGKYKGGPSSHKPTRDNTDGGLALAACPPEGLHRGRLGSWFSLSIAVISYEPVYQLWLLLNLIAIYPCLRASIAVIKHHDKGQLREERAYFPYISGDNPLLREVGIQLLLSMACSAFPVQPTITHLRWHHSQ